jgi:hypothetical protein
MEPTYNLGVQMNTFRTILGILACCSLTPIYASDWQYAGYTIVKNKGFAQFYDADSIAVDGNIVRFWIELIKEKDLQRAGEKHPEFTKATVKKFVQGYVPKFLDTPGKTNNDPKERIAGIALAVNYEILANSLDIPIESTILFEVNCKTKMFAVLSIKDKDKNGKHRSNSIQNPTWDYLTPDTNLYMLSQLLCGSGTK